MKYNIIQESVYDKYRTDINNIEQTMKIFIRNGDYVKTEVDGIIVYNELDFEYNPPRVLDVIDSLGNTLPNGYILVSKIACKLVLDYLNVKDISLDLFYRFFIHHEYGHFRDIFNSKLLTKASSDREISIVFNKIKNRSKDEEIVADKHAITDLNLTLKEYVRIREITKMFLKKFKLIPSQNYEFDRLRVWYTKNNLKPL